jgi:hypothetical protein
MLKFTKKFLISGMLVTLSLVSALVDADELIIPSPQIKSLAQQLSYSDFPKAVDILAIIRVESSFKQGAFNRGESTLNPKRKVLSSRGLMQVQGGSFDVVENMKQGTHLLREYYLMMHRSRKAAIESYNIGPTNYKNHKFVISGEQYWEKYKKHRTEYLIYYKKLGVKID